MEPCCLVGVGGNLPLCRLPPCRPSRPQRMSHGMTHRMENEGCLPPRRRLGFDSLSILSARHPVNLLVGAGRLLPLFGFAPSFLLSTLGCVLDASPMAIGVINSPLAVTHTALPALHGRRDRFKATLVQACDA